eukprot:gene15103-6282_t
MAADWSYDGKNGPDEWPKHFKHCGGKQQSPVDIKPNDSKFQRRNLEHNYKGKHAKLEFSLENNGHSAQVTLENTGKLAAKVNGDEFVPVQVHFHWGSSNNVGSEHKVNGKQYAAEMHFVHMNKKYESSDEALKHKDGLLVLGSFIEVGDENSDLKPIFSQLDDVGEQGEKTEVDDLDISKLMPSNKKDFYFYDGSLTTPKCNEAVKWIVFKDTISISEDQIAALRSLKHKDEEGKDKPIVDNFRPVQALNGRVIYRTFKDE